ncbi:hypothetical protein SAMN05444359_11612 [Neolewinella agarilytica]|uniref:Uncharacterized protein n=1 Tax=Neolewinella agarilytica TaxID=478744 RepID=A0A1H9IYY3_9BACT|nr:hypothetical protein SAMN05444359_11612 [Neolewinella agarilytica]
MPLPANFHCILRARHQKKLCAAHAQVQRGLLSKVAEQGLLRFCDGFFLWLKPNDEVKPKSTREAKPPNEKNSHNDH